MSDPFYIVLPDRERKRIALLQDGSGYSLPTFTRESGTRYHTVATLLQAVREAWHVEVTVSRCLKEGVNGVGSVFLLHNHDQMPELPADAKWVAIDQLQSTTFNNPEHRECITQWLASANDPSWKHVPWSQAGWYERVTKWVNESVEKTGAKVSGLPVQIRVWALSCVLRVDTNKGSLYFKALPDFFGHEPILAKYLDEHFPKYTVEVVAVEPNEHWMLMKEYAGSEPETYDDWYKILKAMKEIQTLCTKSLDAFLALDCSDRRLTVLPSLLEPVIEDLKKPGMLEFYGVNDEEAEELTRRIRLLPDLCAQLADFGIEETIVHGDLWGPNTIVRDTKSDKGPVIFDWTDASIGHPFFDIYISTTSEKNADRRAAQRQAHIDVWSESFPRDKVTKALEVAEQVSPYYFVLSFGNVVRNAPSDSSWELRYLVYRFVRYILNAKEPIYKS
jgi:hypothetical protein